MQVLLSVASRQGMMIRANQAAHDIRGRTVDWSTAGPRG
jgi:hypothetical protein